MTKTVKLAGGAVGLLVLGVVAHETLWAFDGPFGHFACASLYAETGDESLKDKDETSFFGCYLDQRKWASGNREQRAELQRRVAEQQAAEAARPPPPPPPPRPSLATASDRQELLLTYGPPVCAQLQRFPANQVLQLSLVRLGDHASVYALEPEHAPGSADMTTDWVDVTGAHFCTDGGLTGGDCREVFAKWQRGGSLSVTESARTLTAQLECRY